MPETWADIPTFPNYQVSDQGRVRSKPGGRRSGDVLRPNFTYGYHFVGMYRDGKIVRRQVHQLVLEAFVGPKPADKDHGCHRDDDRNNNTLSNLYWGTASENMQDQIRNGNHRLAGRTSCVNGHPFDEANTYYRPDTGTRQCKQCGLDRDKVRRPRRHQPTTTSPC